MTLLPPATTHPYLQQHLPEHFITPRYNGHAISNLPASIGHSLNITTNWASPPLEFARSGVFEDVDRVMLLIVDGLGWNKFQAQLAQDTSGFAEVLKAVGARCQAITSVAPSTTSVATTVMLGNGATPAASGMVGYTFLLPKLGVLANMLFWYPAMKATPVQGELEAWGVTPESFLPNQSIAEVLAEGGVSSRVIMPGAYARSPLSRMRPRGASIDGYINETDMWQRMHAWLRDTTQERAYASVYHPFFDSFSHRDGPDSPSWDALWQNFSWQLQTFLKGISTTGGQRTLFLMTADHGHVHTPESHAIFEEDHPELLRLCALPPGGEARHVYLYAKAGHKSALLEYARAHLQHAFVVLDGEQAIQAGLYGDVAQLHPETTRRIGDVVLLAKGAHHYWQKASPARLLGMHGSLEPDEMLVPLVAFRLDA